jgi:peptidoglycan/xylan/chitin deacetylase (PgdA/CDA1 family)
MALIEKILKAFREIPIEVRRFSAGLYPDFVSAPDPEPLGQQVPVFMFHTVESASFEAQLVFLRRNGYRTLTLDRFMGFLAGRHRLEGPSVLLTFDDGHKSWHDVAWPLLRKYGYHGLGFLVADAIRPAPEADGPWLSWPEVLEIERSGAMTFESHTLRHDHVFVGAECVDFFHPAYHRNPLELDAPWVDRNGRYTNRLALGTPIYRFASRYAGYPRMLDDPALRRSCVDWVARRGGVSFFASRSWRRSLEIFFRTMSARGPAHRYETPSETRRAMRNDLFRARELMSEKLGRPIRHLCFPWGAGSELAVQSSREAGYAGSFWIVHPNRNINRPGDSAFHIPRIKDDYLFRLPGCGRRSPGSILMKKLRRRAKAVHIY